jgi:hypothetical protein
MTLRGLGFHALISKNIYYQQHRFLIRGLRDMSYNGRKGRRMDTTATFFRGA